MDKKINQCYSRDVVIDDGVEYANESELAEPFDFYQMRKNYC